MVVYLGTDLLGITNLIVFAFTILLSHMYQSFNYYSPESVTESLLIHIDISLIVFTVARILCFYPFHRITIIVLEAKNSASEISDSDTKYGRLIKRIA